MITSGLRPWTGFQANDISMESFCVASVDACVSAAEAFIAFMIAATFESQHGEVLRALDLDDAIRVAGTIEGQC